MNRLFPKDIQLTRIAPAGLIIFSILVRLAFLIATGSLGRMINDDGYAYHQIAENLVAGHGFALAPGRPTAFRPFGYPCLLAAVHRMTGEYVVSIQIIQALLGSLLVLPTFQIARRLLSPLTAASVGLAVALHPVLLYLPALFSPGQVALFLQMCLLYLALSVSKRDDRFPRAFFGFVFVGTAATLMRPELLLLPLLLALGHLLSAGLRSLSVRCLSLTALLATALAVVPPVVRNYCVFREFIPLPTIGGATFWGANNAAASGGWILPSEEAWPDLDPPGSTLGWPGLTEKESAARFYAASWAWIRKNPSQALALVPRKIVRSWTLSYADQDRTNTLSLAVHLSHSLFILSAFLGMAVAWRCCRRHAWLLSAPVALWIAKTVVFYGSARHTAMVLPVLSLLSGIALEAIGRSLVEYRAKEP